MRVPTKTLVYLADRNTQITDWLTAVNKAEFDSQQEEDLQLIKLIAEDIANTAGQTIQRIEDARA